MWMVSVGSYGWINLQQVRTVERRETGVVVVHLVGGQEIALLADEAAAREVELEQLRGCRLTHGRQGLETR